jgi:uncharacterized paraquat-inducible protein A
MKNRIFLVNLIFPWYFSAIGSTNTAMCGTHCNISHHNKQVKCPKCRIQVSPNDLYIPDYDAKI